MRLTSFLAALLCPLLLRGASFGNFSPTDNGVYAFPPGSNNYYLVSTDTVCYWPLAGNANAVKPLGADWTTIIGSGVTYTGSTTGFRFGYALSGFGGANCLSATPAVISSINSAGAAWTVECDFLFNSTCAADTRQFANWKDGIGTVLLRIAAFTTCKFTVSPTQLSTNNIVLKGVHQFAKITTDGLLNTKVYVDGTQIITSVTPLTSMAAIIQAYLGGNAISNSMTSAESLGELRIRNVYDPTGTRTADTYLGSYNKTLKRCLNLGL